MNMTIISVTHRLSTAVNADLILVLNKGRVAEEGRYDELVRKNGLFYEMVHKAETTGEAEKKKKEIANAAGDAVLLERKWTRGETLLDSDSVVALEQFTRQLSSRVVDGGDDPLSSVAWYRRRSRGQSAGTPGRAMRRPQNVSLLEQGRAGADKDAANSYMVL
ncbi:hypothetical protein ATCC90586_007600 [Pythium insidiosum]|nr:hypothetical protein ATCC90586_007600 [Pythium insidiosum]